VIGAQFEANVSFGRLRTETSPARIVRTAIAGSYLDRIGGCREPLWRAVRHGREGGAVTSAIEALFLLGNDAWMIPPPVQRAMAERAGARTVEVPGASHSVYVSQPTAVAELIKQAARGLS
jgi:pimeloyl-ACP methyl ester carboxylesterase